MKTIDVLAAVLLVIGGLNWGLYGLFDVDLVASVAGAGSVLARIVYTAVGISAVYQAVALPTIQKRWGVVSPARVG